jgi:hypothetical protein
MWVRSIALGYQAAAPPLKLLIIQMEIIANSLLTFSSRHANIITPLI